MTEYAAKAEPPRPRVAGCDERPDPCGSCDARKFSVCQAIGECDLGRLAAAAALVQIRPGRNFILEGDPADHFFNVTRGMVILSKLLPDGRRQIIGFARTGDFLGLAAGASYTFGAEAITSVGLCRFSRRKLFGLVDDFPGLGQRLLQFATKELVSAQAQMLLLGRKNAGERVASFLLAECDRARAVQAPLDSIELPMTRRDIADYLGLTIETVSRMLTKLKQDGLIALPDHASFILLDEAGLCRVAAGDAP